MQVLRQRRSALTLDPELLRRLELAEEILDGDGKIGPDEGLALLAIVAWGVAA